MTCSDAGRLGGQLIRDRYGPEHFRRIGALARRNVVDQRQRARAGGATTKRRYGSDHYERIATLGGQATLARYGRDYFAELGRKSQARRREGAR